MRWTCGVSFLQAINELLQWLEQELQLSGNALNKMKKDPAALCALRPPPTLEVGKANAAALEDVSHMTVPQVCGYVDAGDIPLGIRKTFGQI